MLAGKKGLLALQDFQLHALGVFRDLPRLKPTCTEDTTAAAPAGCFNETRAVRAACECKKAEAYSRAQRVLAHPR